MIASSRWRVPGEPTSITSSGAPRTCCGVDASAARACESTGGRADYVVVGEDDVEGGDEDATHRVLFEPRLNQEIEASNDLLVLDVRRRRHVVLSVDQLVALPVVGKQHEVVVGGAARRTEQGSPDRSQACGHCSVTRQVACQLSSRDSEEIPAPPQNLRTSGLLNRRRGRRIERAPVEAHPVRERCCDLRIGQWRVVPPFAAPRHRPRHEGHPGHAGIRVLLAV